MPHVSRTDFPRPALILAMACCIALAGLLAPVARAAPPLVVTKTDDTVDGSCDPSNCSLRDAIIAANTIPGADTITLPAGVYTLILGSAGDDLALGGDLDILESVTIEGAGAADTVIKGGASWSDRIFHVAAASASVTIKNVTIREGQAGAESGGAMLNLGTLTLDRSAVAGSAASGGGGIANQGTLTLTDSTVSGNTAAGSTNGGGLLNQGTLALTNSTISNNTANSGGGIANSNTATLSSVTISANTATSGSGGGLLNAAGQVTSKNSLIADNNGATSPDCTGMLSSLGHNLVGVVAGCALTLATGDLTNIDPQLGPLRDNGPPALTHGLFPGSPAIDAGDPAPPNSGGSSCPAKDQRGYARPQTGRCDIGAFEAVGVSIVDFSFQLPTVAIQAGETLRWKNIGQQTHTTLADNNSAEFWASPRLGSGDVYLHTFSTAGIYHYHCALHHDPNDPLRRYMIGTIIVSPPSVNKVPVLTRLDPASAPAGSPALQVILYGTNFAQDALVHWNSVVLTPTNVADDQIIIQVPAELLTTAGKAKVTVVNPGAGGGESNALTFTIGAAGDNPVPVISSISPSAAAVGSGPITLTINGSNFVSGATVQWGTVTLTPTLVTSGQIVVIIPPELLATAGVVNITVVNPGPGGGASNAVPFLVATHRVYLPLARR